MMSNTHTQIYIHIVFAVGLRQKLLQPGPKEEVQKYMTGILKHRRQIPLAIKLMPDHAHIFIGYKPSVPLPDLVRDMKCNSTNLINEKRWVRGKFNWQEGYGAFSYTESHVYQVIKYIQNQEQHHKKKSFKEEYLQILKNFKVEYDEKYLFEFE